MINLIDPSRLRRLLLVGAHSDDIEIGLGGTLLKLAQVAPHLELTWCVFCGDERRQAEAREGARLFGGGFAKVDLVLHGLRDAYLPYLGTETKDRFEQLKSSEPDLVFTHFREDRHQDHRLLSELTWNTFRSHLVLEYEIHKFDGDLGHPNVFVTLDESIADEKCRRLMQAFGSQRSKQWYDQETFRGLMRIRGVECASPTRYAEGFHARKLRW